MSWIESRIEAVFTGDLIGSRGASAEAVERAMDALKNASQAYGTMHEFDPRFTRFRGDGWQVLLPDPRLIMELCLALTARLRAADTGLATRMGIGLGTVDSPGTRDLSDAAGAAFVASGDCLAALARPGRAETILIGGDGAAPWQQGILALGGWIAHGWTAPQAEAVAMMLLDTGHDTNARRARALGISRQAFEARLKGAGLDAFDAARAAFRQHRFEAAP